MLVLLKNLKSEATIRWLQFMSENAVGERILCANCGYRSDPKRGKRCSSASRFPSVQYRRALFASHKVARVGFVAKSL